MNDTITPTRPGSPGRLLTGLVAVAAGGLLGAFGAVAVIELGVAAQPVPSVDGTEWGSPGHITMSADAIEHWLTHRAELAAQAGGPLGRVDPAEWGSPGHITMSADAIEQWINHRIQAPSPYASLSADAAERALTP
jgi:hypothetical protein